MPSFDWVKYLGTVLYIGAAAGALMYGYDALAPTFNNLVSAGHASHIAVQTMNVIYYCILLFGPICLLFSTIQAVLVANARSQYNSPLISTDIGPTVVLSVMIVVCYAFNLVVTICLDTLFVGVDVWTSVPGILDVTSTLNSMFAACHVLCCIAIGIAYLYMIIKSISVETLQWTGEMV